MGNVLSQEEIDEMLEEYSEQSSKVFGDELFDKIHPYNKILVKPEHQGSYSLIVLLNANKNKQDNFGKYDVIDTRRYTIYELIEDIKKGYRIEGNPFYKKRPRAIYKGVNEEARDEVWNKIIRPDNSKEGKTKGLEEKINRLLLIDLL